MIHFLLGCLFSFMFFVCWSFLFGGGRGGFGIVLASLLIGFGSADLTIQFTKHTYLDYKEAALLHKLRTECVSQGYTWNEKAWAMCSKYRR